ncbi:hypothetical protein [Flavobacterium branchiicola]|uniref:Uncharacterized protein n=1 Tax=Flavobacterium branchiicola TaxID=1114875 RepID=A0ABV9PBU2_9FLAO|nr:hypothetical protein [Flavobacterium branchiicola]MBS7253499.1 hypothetical protein [Flavobacterium branchiicola]
MSTNHNRIKVADLETNEHNKILITNSSGELEFSNIDNIKIDSYNGLDYTEEGKALDARQGKVLNNFVENLQEIISKKENAENKIQDIESNKNSSNSFPSVKSIYDWTKKTFKTWLADIENFSSTTYTLNVENINKKTVFSSSTAVAFNIPSDSSLLFPIGTKKEIINRGTGIITIGGTGINFITNIPLTVSNGESRTLTKVEANTWVTSGGTKNSPMVKGVYFVSSSGNDATAEHENPNKPFLTLDNAITSFLADPNSKYIQILSATSFNINVAMNNGTTKKFDLRSDVSCTVNVKTANIYTVNSQSYNVDMPLGNLYFTPPTLSAIGFNNVFVDIKCNLLEFSQTYQCGTGNSADSSIICNTLNVKITHADGIFAGTGGVRKIYIKASNLNFRGKSYLVGTFMRLTLDFDNLTHDDSFLLLTNAFTSGIINHGSITSVAPYANSTNFSYIYGNNISINFKTNAIIDSNISINRFNCSGNCIITGIARFPNSDQFIGGGNNYPGLRFVNANITAKNLIKANNLTKLVSFSDCTFTLLGGFLFSYIESGSGITYDSITADFIGSNYVIIQNDNQNITYDEPFWPSANQPTWNIKNGILYTNGVISSGVNILRRDLNQYNSSIIIA